MDRNFILFRLVPHEKRTPTDIVCNCSRNQKQTRVALLLPVSISWPLFLYFTDHQQNPGQALTDVLSYAELRLKATVLRSQPITVPTRQEHDQPS